MSATCRSCRQPVRWVETTTGRKMPLDPEPVEDGNVVETDVLHEGTSLERVIVRVLALGTPPPPDRLLYRSHFATCPNAAQHRQRRPSRA